MYLQNVKSTDMSYAQFSISNYKQTGIFSDYESAKTTEKHS